MSFSVTILGSSSAKPTLSRHPSAQVVNVHEQYYLVDAGEGVQQQLIRYGINPLRLRAVFISHLHGDHVFGLFPLLSTLALYGRKTPLRVFAPAPMGDMLACYRNYFDSELPYPVVVEGGPYDQACAPDGKPYAGGVEHSAAPPRADGGVPLPREGTSAECRQGEDYGIRAFGRTDHRRKAGRGRHALDGGG